MLDQLQDWFLSLGRDYGVNPILFGTIYVGAIPFFFASIAWLVRRAKAGRSTVVPTLCAGFCFVSAYLYLAIAGRNIPLWVWIFLGALIIYEAVANVRSTRARIRAARLESDASSTEGIAMSSNPTTFQGESGGQPGPDWDDSASLLKRESGGVAFNFQTIRRGTFAELITFVMNLPEAEQGDYAIQKSGDRRFEIGEIRSLHRREDFPRG